MLLGEFVNILYKYSDGSLKKAEYFIFLFDTLINSSTESDNPFYDLQADTLERYFNGKNIAKSKAHKARGIADIHKFATNINNLSECNQISIEDELKRAIPGFNEDDNLRYACADLFLKILDEIYDGTSASYKDGNLPSSKTTTAEKKQPSSTIGFKLLYKSSILSVPEQLQLNYQEGFMPDIAPELTGDPLYLVTGTELGINKDGNEFAEYLENAQEKYQSIKTLLYSDTPKPFYDFYVCNSLTYKVSKGRNSYTIETIHDVTADIQSDCTNFVIITGTGGLGKSMMMRHLLLDCIEQYPIIEKLPIFIPLKDFDDSYDNLTQYVYEKFDALGGDKNLAEFEDILADGRCLLLFDGLDEIHSSVRKLFEKKLDIFADKYSDNIFVISSRPAMSFVAFNRFTVFELNPFNKSQALELIDKLEFRPDEPAIKPAFRKKVG